MMFKKVLIGLLIGAVIIGSAAICVAQTPAEADKSSKAGEEVLQGEASVMPTEARYFAGATDVGVVRDHNEDSYGIFREAGVYLVADGMGGHAAGEVASAMAVEWIGKLIKLPFFNYLRQNWPEMSKMWLQHSYDEAHRQIFARSMRNYAERGMGTTAVSVLTTPSGVWIVNLGDSRAYRIRDGHMVQISHDHSLVQQLIDTGQLRTPEEIERFPYKNIITRVMGTDGDHENEAFYDKPRLNDIYVLCSDGLTNEVDDEEIMKIILKHGTDLQSAADELIQTARKNGGRDNITAVLVMM